MVFQGNGESRFTCVCVCVCVCVLIAQSCLSFCNPMDWSPPGSSVHGILQQSIREWIAIPFSRGSSWPRDPTQVSWTAGRFFTIWSTREARWGFIPTVQLVAIVFALSSDRPYYSFCWMIICEIFWSESGSGVIHFGCNIETGNFVPVSIWDRKLLKWNFILVNLKLLKSFVNQVAFSFDLM